MAGAALFSWAGRGRNIGGGIAEAGCGTGSVGSASTGFAATSSSDDGAGATASGELSCGVGKLTGSGGVTGGASSSIIGSAARVRSEGSAATGVTQGYLLDGVTFTGGGATTQSIVMRSKSGTVRRIHATHRFDTKPSYFAAGGR